MKKKLKSMPGQTISAHMELGREQLCVFHQVQHDQHLLLQLQYGQYQ
jgi:hypothetical protein